MAPPSSPALHDGMAAFPGPNGTSGFYRFVPRDADDLTRGGRLQMLKVDDNPAFMGWLGQSVGKTLHCQWVDIDKPDPNLAAGQVTCFAQ